MTMSGRGRQQQTIRICAIRYLIYVPAGDEGPVALAECLAYAERDHPEWDSCGVIVGAWQAVISMLVRGLADIVVIAQRSHLPADRLPRIVAVEEELSAPSSTARDSRRPAGRRPRLF